MPDTLTLSTIDSPAGQLTLVTKGNCILICEFADRQARVERQIERFYSNDTIVRSDTPTEIANAFKAYFSGNCDVLNTLSSKPQGTAYEQSVWRALQNIPVGNTTSYGALAKTLNSSPRAIGRANGRNPVCLIHPCHRVIGADGSLTGYAGGLHRKEWLLKHEGVLLAL